MTLGYKLCASSLFLGFVLLMPQRAAGWTLAACSKLELETGSKGTATHLAEQRKLELETSYKGTAIDLDWAEQRKNFLNAKSQCMSAGQRAVPAALLDEDKRTIDAAYPDIRNFYVSKNHRNEDVARVVSLAWTGFRWKNQSEHMSAALFIQLSTSYGQLTVNSDPAGASISVDAKPWDDPTNRTDWTEAGERSVRLTKKGCKPEEGKALVPAGGSTTFERILKCGQ